MNRRRAAAAALAVVLALAGCASSTASPAPSSTAAPSAAATAPPGTTMRTGLVYRTVDGDGLALDAYLPKHPVSRPMPAIVVVHGGSFSGGRRYSPDALRMVSLVAQAGYAAFSIDYRLLPKHPYPDALEDLQAAIRWLRAPEQAAAFGIDPARIGAFGGSAGAILVAEAGAAGEGPLDEGARLGAVVALSGIMDFTAEALTPDLDAADRRTGLAYLDCTDPSACPVGREASPLFAVDPSDP